VVIEYAGASGASSPNPKNAVAPGNGSKLKTDKIKIQNETIFGIIASIASGNTGGSGYHNGNNGTWNSASKYGGGGGGSTSVQYKTTVLEASGGAGQAVFNSTTPFGDSYFIGGNGAGPHGGVAITYPGTNDAKDPNQIGTNSGNGYVKIWAGYDPFL
jgi:hypothetical protein